jgi:hypothetical protein
MGSCSTQLRIQTLTSYVSDLEFSTNMVMQQRSTLAYQTQVAAEQYPELAAQYHLLDKKLEAEQKTIETQSKMAAGELEGLKKTLDANIKEEFSVNLRV